MKSRFWKSRLPGPFLISFLLCFALIDYIIYSATKDSPLGLLWQILALVIDVFRNLPLSDYVSVMTLFLLGSIVLFIIIVVVVSKGSATKAMQATTEKVVGDRPLEFDHSSLRTGGGILTVGKVREETQVLTRNFEEPRPLNIDHSSIQARGVIKVDEVKKGAQVPPENFEESRPREGYHWSLRKLVDASVSMRPSVQWQLPDLGVTAKMVLFFAGIAALFGLGTTAIVYYLSFGVFETQINKRADVIALNLSEAVARQMSEKNLVGLRAELSKYAGQEDVAYIFVEDDTGNVVSKSVEDLPVQDAGSILQPSSKFTHWAPILYRGYPVYETRAGIAGKLGILHLGIWKDAVEKEIRGILWPIAISILVVTLVGIIAFSVVVRGISRLLLQLAQSANRISEGELDASSWINRKDEIGKLAVSLERIRASLTAATKRLDPTHSARSKPIGERPLRRVGPRGTS